MNTIPEKSRAEKDGRTIGMPGARSHVDRVTAKENHTRAFALDISGKVMDNTAYEGQGKTAEDVMQQAGQTDVAMQKNFLTVMSNSMSAEDFAKLQEEGHFPAAMDAETVVTIVDQIKAALIRGGSNIRGYTDNLDAKTLEKITGDVGLANAMVEKFREYNAPVTSRNAEDTVAARDTLEQIQPPSDGTIKYMIRNEMDPTIDNIYRAQYSAASEADRQGRGYYQDETGHYARKAENFDWEKLEPQMEKIIDNAGLEVTKDTKAEAKWLIEKGMALTEKALTALHAIRNLTLPQTSFEIAEISAMAAAEGRTAGQADLSVRQSKYRLAVNYTEEIGNISAEAADRVLAEGKTLNLRNLRMAQYRIDYGQSKTEAEYEINPSGRLKLEEARLRMSAEANLHLIRKGFSIDTTELGELVEALKNAESERNHILFGGDNENSLYQTTLKKVSEIPAMPAAIAAGFSFRTTAPVSFTIDALHEEGKLLKSNYEKAGEQYEALMTEPRADLGDSIKKAFRNVEELLREAGVETTEENRRAARILGYNRMEITQENLNQVKSTDLTIRRVINKMTPAATMKMIREGMNPLSVNMEELETYFDSQEQSPQQDIEKYSEFLYKMEQKDQVTANEREAFIGIYRLFRQLDKTDGAAIGTLISNGMEPTMRNLLTAMRSNKKQGMDVSVDQLFGGAQGSYDKSISEQIESGYRKDSSETGYYKKLAAHIFDHLDAEKLPKDAADIDYTLEELARILSNSQTDTEAEDYQIRQIKQFREAGTAEDYVIKELLEFDQPVTADNLLAAGLLHKGKGKLADRMAELAVENGMEKEFKEAVSRLEEGLTDVESAKAVYSEMQRTLTDILEESVYGDKAEERINLREISSLQKQIALAGNLAKEENYHIPVEIDGEMTAIHLTIMHDSRDKGKVSASMQTKNHGAVSAQFAMNTQGQLTGYIVSDNRETMEILHGQEDLLKKTLEESGVLPLGIHYIHGNGMAAEGQQESRWKETNGDKQLESGEQIPTQKLYQTAKTLIRHIRNTFPK